MTDFNQIERMTLYEYEIRMTAYNLKTLDEERFIHEQAWANQQVKATKSIGKNKTEPYFKEFKSFFDYQKKEKEILGIEETPTIEKDLSNLLRKANS